MQRKTYNIFIFFLILSALKVNAQSFPIGNWREHLPYLQGKSVEVTPDRVYCATADGLFALRLNDNSIERFSKLNKLNDFGVSTIGYNESQKVLVVIYNNTNIDLLFDNGTVVNMSDIKRKNIPGNKTVNRISFSGDLAYLSCGFGVVVLDLLRQEIKDTYYISASGSDADINDVAVDGSIIYAASNSGIYRASLTDPAINNYTAWQKIADDTAGRGDYTQAELFNGQVYFNYSLSNGDSMMVWNGTWGSPLPSLMQSADRKLALSTSNGRLYMTESDQIAGFDASLQPVVNIDGSVVPGPSFKEGTEAGDGTIWIAEATRGLLKVNGGAYEKIQPEGPNSSLCATLLNRNGDLWVVHGPRTKGWNNQYRQDGFSLFSGGEWKSWDGYAAGTPFFSQYGIYDNFTIAIDPVDGKHMFVGSGGAGLLELYNMNPVTLYRDTNSTLLQQFGNPGQVKVHGIAFDDDRNLWVSNAGVNSVVNVYKTDGTWRRFTFPGKINSSAKTGDMIIDNNGYVWTVIFENTGGKDGILVFNPNRTPDNTADDQYDVVDMGTSRVRCMAKDKDGTIWIGTETGIYLFYPPSITPQRILIRQDNQYQYLLSGEVVTALTVDGANRKWVGTESGGLYLFSADGQSQIQHFTAENSPLFSNSINSLSINATTGEVFVGTDKGLISYQGDAIEADELITGCQDVVVYPNPVESSYSGPVAIKGVVPNGIIKITDVNGGLVYQTTSLGTQAVWNGNNLQGEEVSTGVYIVFSSDASGENSCTTKLMYFK